MKENQCERNQLRRDVKTIDIASDSQTSLQLAESLKLQILNETLSRLLLACLFQLKNECGKFTTKMAIVEREERLLLLGDTDCASTTSSGLGVLTADSEAPVVTHTAMGADFLETLQILTQLRIDQRGGQLGIFAVDDVLLSVQEPIWDLVLTWVRDDGHNLLDLQ